MLKSKVDSLVFIKIAMSKLLVYVYRSQKLLNLTPAQPKVPKNPKSKKKTQNIAKLKTKKDRAVLPKQKLIVYISRSQTYFRT